MKKLTILVLALFVFMGATACKEEKYIHVGPNWAALNDLKPSDKTFGVDARGERDLKLGDEITFTVTSTKAGKLWVVQVDPKDRVTLLFPNEQAKENALSANKPFNVPPKDANWDITAGEPAGKSIVAFIVTTGGTDLQDVLGQQKNMTKALRLVERTPAWGLEKVVVDVK